MKIKVTPLEMFEIQCSFSDYFVDQNIENHSYTFILEGVEVIFILSADK